MARRGLVAGLVAGLLALAGCESRRIPTVKPTTKDNVAGKPSSPVSPNASSKDAGKPTRAALASTREEAEAIALDRLRKEAAEQGPAPFQFDDATERLGIDFRHVSGNSPEKHFPAANSSGVAMFDFDLDGNPDLHFVTCRRMPFKPGSPPEPDGPINKLFRNMGDRFVEVGASAGLAESAFAHGVAQGDFNGDGFPDLAISHYGGTRIFLNQGDGCFRENTDLQDKRWGASLAAFDGDRDGLTDLYVTHYGHWSIETNKECGDLARRIRTFCSPREITPARHALYRNLGDGRFEDIAASCGCGREDGRGQGVVAADLDHDGDIDLFVANDQSKNFLFVNNGNGTFRDLGDLAGVAVNAHAQAMAGMGVDAGDADGDGLPDLTVTNFQGEWSTLHINMTRNGRLSFVDRAHFLKLAMASRESVNWGTRFADFDGDGWQDVFCTAGHVDDNVHEMTPGLTYVVPPKLWRNMDGKEFKLYRDCGSYFTSLHVGRGAALGDLDNDGLPDIALNHVDSRASVLLNRSPAAKGRHWLRVALAGRVSGRIPVGTRVVVKGDGLARPELTRQLVGGASYASTHDDRLLFGLAGATQVRSVTAHWPSGAVTTVENVAADREILLVEPDPPGA
jgi:hypothetical protein